MAEAALGFLLENLTKLVAYEYHLITGAEKELRQVKNELKLMKAFLEESASKRVKGKKFRTYEKQIRDAVHSTEDTIDACIVESQKSKIATIYKRTFAQKVKKLREDIIEPVFHRAMMDFATLPLDDDVDPTNAEDDDHQNRKHPILKVDNVVGFDKEADTVITYLTREYECLEVISIIGMPGLGKTTLAWKIYHDPRIHHYFHTRIWIYVSQEFNRRDVFLAILKHFTQGYTSPGKTDDELASDVRTQLEGKHFVLFMDDVWTAQNWGEIEVALPKATTNSGGKVLITSRNEDVARRANPTRESHKLGFLDSQLSWQLLQLEIYGKLDVCPADLVVLGKSIAKQCGGVPLAIVVIGGILLAKSSTLGGGMATRLEWEKVSNSVSASVLENMENRTEKFIELSYDKLPFHLKDCFLYLGMFQEDTEILAWKLIRLWIAEGFIQQKPEKSLEEVAEDNLKDLINRNLVMVVKTKAEGHVKTCRVHDMIREFCKQEAAFSQQNLFDEVKKTKEGEFYPSISKINEHRRLCIHSYVVEFLYKKPKDPHPKTRSFLCFSKEALTLALQDTNSIPDAFKLLRVLDVNPITFTKFPSNLAKLIHLRYIALSGDKFKILPKDISKLWNLQTVRIDTTERTLEVKVDILNMKELRHFKTKAAIVLNKEAKGEAAAENLQTLSRLSAQSCTEDVFTRASNLKNLGILGELSVVLDSKWLKKLDRLQKLKLVYNVYPGSSYENPLRNLPQADRFPPNLRVLTLSATFLEWEKHMPILGTLRTLEVLKLKEKAFKGNIWEAGGGGFPSLEFLHMGRTDLEFWAASGGNPFPRLKCLVLKNCEKLEEIPLVLGETLEVLDIERVKQSTVASARKIEQQQLGRQRMQGPQQRTRGFKLIVSPGDIERVM